MNLCDEIVVLNFGNQIAQGTPAEVRSDREVVAAYLGAAAEPESPDADGSTASATAPTPAAATVEAAEPVRLSAAGKGVLR